MTTNCISTIRMVAMVAFIVFTCSTDAVAQFVCSPPVRLSNTYDNFAPVLATDRAGHWVAVWNTSDTFLPDLMGLYSDVLVARSSDNGATWTVPTYLNNTAMSEPRRNEQVSVSTDSDGHWVAVWESLRVLPATPNDPLGTDIDILVARSDDNGATWTDPAPLNSNATTDSIDDNHPRVYTDEAGTWIATWHAYNDLLGDPLGDDIYMSRSTDNGVTWSTRATLNPGANNEIASDEVAELATDKHGNWVATWIRATRVDFGIFETRIVAAHSTDNGVSWTGFTPLSMPKRYVSKPHVATDGNGHWVATWEQMEALGDPLAYGEAVVTRSNDVGATWTEPIYVSSLAPDSRYDEDPLVATDGAGNWIVMWWSNIEQSDEPHCHVLAAYSSDEGVTWSAPVTVRANVSMYTMRQHAPQVVAGSKGHWVGAWVVWDPQLHNLDIEAMQLYIDSDGDIMNDTFEHAIVDYDPNDAIGSIADVLPFDDFDGDGVSNLQEFRNHSDPTSNAAGLRILRPNGGERLTIGEKYKIRWVSTDFLGTEVQLSLWRNGIFDRIIKNATPNDGKQNFRVKRDLAPGDGYQIHIRSVPDGAFKDTSDGTFGIEAVK